MRGAQGPLTHGLGERSEEAVVAVELPSFKLLLGESPALGACAGTFLFLEFRYRDLQQERQRALMLYMTTCSSKHYNVVKGPSGQCCRPCGQKGLSGLSYVLVWMAIPSVENRSVLLCAGLAWPCWPVVCVC